MNLIVKIRYYAKPQKVNSHLVIKEIAMEKYNVKDIIVQSNLCDDFIEQ